MSIAEKYVTKTHWKYSSRARGKQIHNCGEQREQVKMHDSTFF